MFRKLEVSLDKHFLQFTNNRNIYFSPEDTFFWNTNVWEQAQCYGKTENQNSSEILNQC